MIRTRAPAKVNLTLRVLAREASGYHSLETLFCAVSLFDRIGVERADAGIELKVAGEPPTSRPAENLVVRAAERFAAGARLSGGLRIHLEKRIPAAAGLGGGSADAAATLLALDALTDGPVERRALLDWAAGLGSDVPFFLCGSPLALGWSRGERLLALPALPARPLLIANPGADMPTAGAFRRLAELRGPEHREGAALISLDDLESWERIAALASNDFEPLAIERLPVIGEGLHALREAGAIIAMLAGSGASIYGIFHDPPSRNAAEPALAELGFTTWRAETLEKMPLPGPARDPSGPPGAVDPARRPG